MPAWVKNVVDQWIQAANFTSGKLLRRVHKMEKTWGERLTEKAVWYYLGCKQRIQDAVNDKIGIEPPG